MGQSFACRFGTWLNQGRCLFMSSSVGLSQGGVDPLLKLVTERDSCKEGIRRFFVALISLVSLTILVSLYSFGLGCSLKLSSTLGFGSMVTLTLLNHFFVIFPITPEQREVEFKRRAEDLVTLYVRKASPEQHERMVSWLSDFHGLLQLNQSDPKKVNEAEEALEKLLGEDPFGDSLFRLRAREAVRGAVSSVREEEQNKVLRSLEGIEFSSTPKDLLLEVQEAEEGIDSPIPINKTFFSPFDFGSFRKRSGQYTYSDTDGGLSLRFSKLGARKAHEIVSHHLSSIGLGIEGCSSCSLCAIDGEEGKGENYIPRLSLQFAPYELGEEGGVDVKKVQEVLMEVFYQSDELRRERYRWCPRGVYRAEFLLNPDVSTKPQGECSSLSL